MLRLSKHTSLAKKFCKWISPSKKVPEHILGISELEMSKAGVKSSKVKVISTFTGQAFLAIFVINLSLLFWKYIYFQNNGINSEYFNKFNLNSNML